MERKTSEEIGTSVHIDGENTMQAGVGHRI